MLSPKWTHPGGDGIAGALDAVRRVWASKWNDRAVLSMRKAGQPHSAVQVRLLCPLTKRDSVDIARVNGGFGQHG